MSRTMRFEILSLELASHKSHINTLVRSAVPASSTSLDKLIDISHTPLPDAFLDEQERLEDATKVLTEGLPAFLSEMATQWRHGDEVFWGARGAETGSETLVRDVEEALLKLPESGMAEAFEKRAGGLRKELDETREAMGSRRRKGFLPMPEHGAAKEQKERNVELVKGLEANVEIAGRELNEAVEVVERYRFAAVALDRSREVRKQTEETSSKLRSFVAAVERLSGRPNLDDPACLHSTNEETAFDQQFAKLAFEVRPPVDSTPPLLHRASSVVVDLNKAGIDPNVRQAVKETMAGLSKVKARVEELLAEEVEGRQRLKAARALAMGLYECGEGVSMARKRIETAMDDSRWVEGRIVADYLDIDALLDTLRQQIDTALVAPLAVAKALLLPHCPLLYAHLLSRASTLRATFDNLLRLQIFLDRTKQQQEATSSVLSDFDDVDAALRKTASHVDAAVVKPREAWAEGALEDEHSALAESTRALAGLLTEVVEAVHLRIPFFAQTPTPPPPPSAFPTSLSPLPIVATVHTSLPFDLVKQDAAVRAFVNAKSAAVGGGLEEVKRKLGLLEHQGEAFEWDERAEEAGMALEEHEKEVREAQQQFEMRSSDAEGNLAVRQVHRELTLCTADVLALLLSLVTSASAALSTSGDSHTALRTSLDALRASPSPSAASPPFDLHLSRQSVLDGMLEEHRLALEASATLAASIKSADNARRAREEKERIRAAEQAAKLRELLAQVVELMEDFVGTREAAEAIETEVDDQVLNLDTWWTTVRQERVEMLESHDLSSGTAPDSSSLRLAHSTLDTLRDRFTAVFREATQLELTFAALRTEFSSLDTPEADFSMVSALAAIVGDALLSTQSRLDALESQLDAAESEIKAFEDDRAEVLEVRRRMAEEARSAVEAERICLEGERLRADAELARVEEEHRVAEEEAAKLMARRGRVGEIIAALERTRGSTTATSGEMESLAQAVDAWSDAARQERLEMLESDSLSQDTRPDDIPFQLAQSTLPSLQQRLDTLRSEVASHGTALVALESDSSSRASYAAELSLARVVEEALSAASSRLATLHSTVQAAADDAALFDRDRAGMLETRRLRAEEERLRVEAESARLEEEAAASRRAETEARLKEERLEKERLRRASEEASWALKQDEQLAGLSSITDSLRAYEGLLETCEDALATLISSAPLPNPYPSPSSSRLSLPIAPDSVSSTPLDRARASHSLLLSDRTLNHATVELDTIDESRTQLRESISSAGGAVMDALSRWTTPAPESLRAQIVRLREASTDLADALAKAIAHEELRITDATLRPEERAAEVRGVRRLSNEQPAPTSGTDVEDVFGPTLSTIPFPHGYEEDVEISQVAELQDQLAAIDVDSWADEKPFLQLPSSADAAHISRQLSLVHALLDDLVSDATGSGLELDADLAPFRSELERKALASERITSLARFKEKVEVADSSLSDLLTSIDAATPSNPHPSDLHRSSSPTESDVHALPLATALLHASSVVTIVRKKAIPLLDDSRVEAQVGRVEEAYGEMMAMVEDLNPRPSSCTSSVWSSRSRIPSRLSSSSRPSSSRQSSHPSSSRQPISCSSSTTLLPSRPASATPSSTRVSSRSSLSHHFSDPHATPRKSSHGSTPTSRLRLPTSATVPRSFSFGTTAKGGLPRSVSSGAGFLEPSTPRRESLGASKRSRKESLTPSMRSSRKDSMASSTSSFRRSLGPSPTMPLLGGGRKSNGGAVERKVGGVSQQGRTTKMQYKADPQRKVDVEVGRIVNEFPVSPFAEPPG